MWTVAVEITFNGQILQRATREHLNRPPDRDFLKKRKCSCVSFNLIIFGSKYGRKCHWKWKCFALCIGSFSFTRQQQYCMGEQNFFFIVPDILTIKRCYVSAFIQHFRRKSFLVPQKTTYVNCSRPQISSLFLTEMKQIVSNLANLQ